MLGLPPLRIHDSQSIGVHFEGQNVSGRLEGCDVYRNTSYGIIVNMGAHLLMSRCR